MTRRVGVVVLLAGALTGCVSERNERLVIGTRPTPSFALEQGPDAGETAGTAESTGAAGPGEPDRRRWRTTVVVAPIDGVVHTATLRTEELPGRRADAREAGVFPTIQSVTGGRSPAGGAHDLGPGFDELGRVLFDPFLSPVRTARAWRGGWWTWSPISVWKRTPGDRTRPGTIAATRDGKTAHAGCGGASDE